MTAVNISGTFKRDERDHNGLEAIADQLDKDPMTRRLVVGIIETTRTVVHHADGGSRTVVVKFDAIEALDGHDAATARALLDARHTERTGRTVDDTLFDGHAGDGLCGPIYADPLDREPVGVCTQPRGHADGDHPTAHVYQPEWDPADDTEDQK